ncbi:hypothetical protein Plhal304r1_c016g0057821 [Plasmopara halstedii]
MQNLRIKAFARYIVVVTIGCVISLVQKRAGLHRDMARSEEGLVSNRIWDLTSPSVSPAVRSLAWLPALEDPVCVVMVQNQASPLMSLSRSKVSLGRTRHRIPNVCYI